MWTRLLRSGILASRDAENLAVCLWGAGTHKMRGKLGAAPIASHDSMLWVRVDGQKIPMSNQGQNLPFQRRGGSEYTIPNNELGYFLGLVI